VLEPWESVSTNWSLRRMYGWYDLVITVEGDPGFEYQFAGHVETGEDSISDPAMGAVSRD
jgi:phospholipase C